MERKQEMGEIDQMEEKEENQGFTINDDM